jgi:threonine dehydrogenase-like Zn-dependent dehydrogenase
MGHELAGVVVAVGEDVTGLRPGDRVVSPFTTACGRCFFCRRGLTSRCDQGQLLGWRNEGRGLHGAQAELVRVPLADTTLVGVPEATPLEIALLAGDVLATGWYAADRCGAPRDGLVVVVGCGAVGLCAVLALRELGVERVLAVDLVDSRLAMAESLGAVTLRLAPDVVGAVREATEGRGADAVVEAVGSESAARLALEVVRAGGTISTVGVHTEARMAFSPAEAYDRNLTYRAGRCPARAYLDRLVPRLPGLAGRLRGIVSHRLPLTEATAAYRSFGSREEGWTKVVFEPAGGLGAG